MPSPVKLGVCRRLDNRFEGFSDDAPRALELHRRRAVALHDILDNEKSIQVLDWGYTDDCQPHEFVEISLSALASAALTYVLVPGLQYVAAKLAEKAVDQAAAEVAKWLMAKLRPKQELQAILDFQIRLPDGTTIQVDPLGRYARISIAFPDGTVSSITYTSQGTN